MEIVQLFKEMMGKARFVPFVVVGVDLQLREASKPSPQSPRLPLVKRIAIVTCQPCQETSPTANME